MRYFSQGVQTTIISNWVLQVVALVRLAKGPATLALHPKLHDFKLSFSYWCSFVKGVYLRLSFSLLRGAIHPHRHVQLERGARLAGGGVWGELQEELFHRVRADRLQRNCWDLQVPSCEGLWCPATRDLQDRARIWVLNQTGGSLCGGRCGWMHHWGWGEVWGRDLWIHHQHQVLQVAQGGVQCLQEASEEVHPYYRLHQGAQGALCPSRLWLQAGCWGVLRQSPDWASMALTTPSLTSNRRSSSTLELGSVGLSILFTLNQTAHHRNKLTQQHIVVSIWMLISTKAGGKKSWVKY